MYFSASVAIFKMISKKLLLTQHVVNSATCLWLLGPPILAYFHLISHAFCALFLVRVCDSLMSDEQNIKNMGGLFNKIPQYLTMIIGSLSLIGIPFFSEYFSKDLILETLFLRILIYLRRFFIGLLVLFNIILLRLIIYVFHGAAYLIKGCSSFMSLHL